MAANGLEQLVVGVSVGEVILLTGSIGWLFRRYTARMDTLVTTVAELSQHMAISSATAPEVTRRLIDLEDVAEETRRTVAVIVSWREGHERWHELHLRHGPAT
jgi:hypothetical protein